MITHSHSKLGLQTFLLGIVIALLLSSITLGPVSSEPVDPVDIATSPTISPDLARPDERSPQELEGALLPQGRIGHSPFDPPEPADTVFIQDSDGNMDQYLFRDEGPILFHIPIDRYAGPTDTEGFLLNPDHLKQNGIVSQQAHLQLVVYDVDEDYSGTEVYPEVDKVYLNGQYIGDLTGANNQWSVTRLDFDISLVKFARSTCDESTPQPLSACHTPPTPSDNEIRIDIDTANVDLIWAVEVDWGSLYFDAARPILFVHGKGGQGNDWDINDGQYYFGFRGRFSEDGFITATTEQLLGSEVSLRENASRLAPIVGWMETRYGVDRINLVGHSKGGLDSRAYISDRGLNPNNGVATLVTLGSPHHGSALADLGEDISIIAEFLGLLTDAAHDVTERHMNDIFNPATPAREDVTYYAIAANAGHHFWYGWDVPLWQAGALPNASQRAAAPFVWFILSHIGQYKGHNDFLVTVPSTEWSGISGHNGVNSHHLGSFERNHHSMRAALRAAGELDLTLVDLIESRLNVHGPSGGQPQAIKSGSDLAVTHTDPGPSTIGIHTGQITQGTTALVPVGVDSNARANFSLLWTNGELNMELVAPDGTVITPASVVNPSSYTENRIITDTGFLLDTKIASYFIVSPTVGLWQARVIAASTLPSGSSDWALLVAQESSLTLALSGDALWYQANNPALVQATLVQDGIPVTGASVALTATLPNSTTVTLLLYDDGSHGDSQPNDGMYTTNVTIAQPGARCSLRCEI